MALMGPILDDRTYEQLRTELIRRIPVHTPEWTDHNESDPGIALLDLFAYLGESLLYRFNQIPDATKVAFLRLLDVQPRPARPAQVLVVARTEAPEGVQLLAGREVKAGPVSFETGGEVYVWPLEALGAGKAEAPRLGDDDSYEKARREEAVRRVKKEKGQDTEVEFYDTAVLPTDPTAPDAVPLDVDGTLDQALWVALLEDPTTDVRRIEGHTVFLGIALDESVDRPFSMDTADAEDYRSTGLDRSGPGMRWELWQHVENTETTADAADEPSFVRLEVVRDSTAGLTTSGVVALTLPRPLPPRPPEQPTSAVTSPPRLDDPEQARRVIGWLRATRPPESGAGLHRVRWIGANAVEAVQARTSAGAELLGVGTGDGGQVYRLTQTNVLPGTVLLEVEEDGVWQTWAETEDLSLGGPGDRLFAVEPADGLVRFGPGGQQGRVPQIGQRIRVRSYRYGGGAAGNVPAGAVTAVTGVGGVTVTNPLPADGGREPEALDAALDRIPAEVHRRERAVVADDFRELALRLPGVARAETLPLFHPDTPAQPAAGVVSVVVFPTDDVRDPGAPLPDRALLRRVARYLDERRLLTTELYVLPPEYRKVSVAVGLAVTDGHQVDAVRRWVELIIRQFLAPVPPYGPNGGGWPLGRVVRGAELEAVAVQVEGVDYLQGLSLAEESGDRDHPWRTVTQVVLRPWEVAELADITVVAGPPLEPGAGYRPPPGPGDVVQVPLPREVC
ncbi:putative baseplate assembly protein [Streptomyces sp. NPDC002817]|uniref:putative baseplate assembly protein n=1 Tax=Streptomyces sp. NPDC088357 TaxID=3154655 RepID=UPI003425D9F9